MILVVGDVMTDVIVRPDGPAAPGTDQAATILRRFGGSGANIACWLGHCGVVTRFAGRVGAADLAAHEAAFASQGVEARLVPDPALGTGTVVALLGPDGGRGFFTDRAANLALSDPDLPDSLLDGARALHVSGHVFFAPGPRAAARRLMARARERGLAISIDAGSAGWMARAGGAAFRDWTRDAALCLANADEARLLEGGYDVLVITHGACGAELRHGGEVLRVPAKRTSVLDGTGAGDAFAAGFLARRWLGGGFADCLRAGSECAAACVMVAGGRPPSGSPPFDIRSI